MWTVVWAAMGDNLRDGEEGEPAQQAQPEEELGGTSQSADEADCISDR